MTPDQERLQQGILDAVQKRIELAQEAAALYVADAEAEHVYLLAKARALVQVEGKNADERKGQVDQITAREFLEHRIADAKAKAVREAINAQADKISAYQSLLRLERAEAEVLRYGQGGAA